MQRIPRQPEAAAATDYDLIIVGGGVYGVFTALHAARCGLRPLLLERDDFGGGVSSRSLRIIHGGLRYLQNLDLLRHRESVAERRWHLQSFPGLVRPLSCLMPLYGQGLKRPSTFRAALMMNDALSMRRNRNVREDCHLPRGKMIRKDAVTDACPRIPAEGLRGGGMWYDAIMLSSERVLIETLAWAVSCGATVLNYVEAADLITEGNAVAGVAAVDRVTGQTYTYRAAKVVNCAGPACRALAGKWDRDEPALFRKSLAFNLLFDRPAVSEHALAVSPVGDKSKAYFVVPWKRKVMAGTYHCAWPEDRTDARPGEELIGDFIGGLNASLPGLELKRDEVRRVYAGLLPAARAGGDEPSHRPEVVDHGDRGGPRGLFSVSGVKWTTARRVAEVALSRIMGRKLSVGAGTEPSPSMYPQELCDLGLITHDAKRLHDRLGEIVRQESVVYLDDLVLRRVAGLDGDEAVVAAAWAGAEVLGLEGQALGEAWGRLVAGLEALGDAAAGAVADACPAEHQINRGIGPTNDCIR